MKEDVTEELMQAMREMQAIVRGEAQPARVHNISLPLPVDVRKVRKQTGLSRVAFAEKFALDARAVQDWEQGRRMPDRAARAYLTVISKRPDAVLEALAG